MGGFLGLGIFYLVYIGYQFSLTFDESFKFFNPLRYNLTTSFFGYILWF